MPNTTNFNFPTPADTDLVKDGASAIRSLGNSIDTAFVDLKGGTTGQILSKASNTDLDYTWITNDVGDITNVAVTSPITGGGSSGSVTIGIQDGTTAQKGAVQLENSTSSTSTTTAAVPASVKSAYDLADGAIAKSLVDAKGDLIVGTADNTVARLASSASNGNVLTVDTSTASGLKWAAPAGGLTFAGVSLENTANNQSLSNNTFTVITWNTENYDTDGYHSTSSNTSRITIPSGKGGKYLITGSVYFDPSSTTGMRELRLYKNGADTGKFFMVTASGSGTWYPNPQINFVVNAVATDYFEMYARQNSGGNLTQYFDTGCWFQASYLGA